MAERKRISTGDSWESVVGYSRAIRFGSVVEVAGTTAVKDGQVVAKGDPYGQTRFILEKIQGALKEAGASLEHVVRTRIFVTDIAHWQQVGKAHGEFFRDIRPASTMVEVSGLVNPEMLVEIEVTAVVD
jgi:enamine deaminase RidA (YjgF/YER057c/UK114 family)